MVDDDPTVRLLGARLLEKLGCAVDAVDDGQSAIQAFLNDSFDLILMDHQLPIMDGPTATIEIRRLEQGEQHIPIIAITASVAEHDRKTCLDAGMDGYLAKPIKLIHLEAMLGQWLTTSKEASAEN